MDHSRSFRRDVGELDSIFAFVAQFIAGCGIDVRHTFDVDLVLEELFTNMVKYNGGRRDIGVRLGKVGDVVEIVLTDYDVEPFDITQVPDLDLDEPLASRRLGGWGLHLVRKLTDGIVYRYENRCSTITVTKKLEP